MLVVAPAGYGKTSALAQALAAVPKSGTDLWVQCDRADNDPDVLLRGVLRSGGVEATGGVGVDRVVDLLAGHAPDDVCLVLDDVHLIDRTATTWAVLGDLIERLPWNAHLVLSGRDDPHSGFVRLRAAGDVVQLGLNDLEFDDDELIARWSVVAADSPSAAFGDAARWPALAALVAVAPTARPVDFVVEELVPAWDLDRFAAIAAVAHLRDIDDAAVAAATTTDITAAELLEGLPLVLRSPGGTFQLHDLWRQALTSPATWARRADPAADAVTAALSRVARARLAADELLEAADLFAAAGDADGLVEAALAFSAQPFLRVAASELERIAAHVSAVIGDHVVSDLVGAAQSVVAGDEGAAAARFEVAARRAADEGLAEIEALALQHAANMRSILDPDNVPTWIHARASSLADRYVTARNAVVMAGYQNSLAAGRPDSADEFLEMINPPTSDRELITFCFGKNDLGRPDDVEVLGLPGEPETMRIEVAASLWLRGDVPPELAFQLGSSLVDSAEAGGFAHHVVQTNAVLALIALSAGRTTDARRFADHAVRGSAATVSIPVQTFALLGDALCVLCERGEESALPAIDAMLARLPITTWPGRPYLWALPTIYVMAPSTRGVIDGCRFGSAISAALDAGRALVAVREHGDPAPALALAWDRRNLLRAHVVPPHLAELAAAAAAAGSRDSLAVLDELPSARRLLAEVAMSDHVPSAIWATERIATMPARPPDDLTIDVLGPLRLRRGATPVTDSDWINRERVRRLLAYLALHRRSTRRAAAAALWPELDADKAAHNLRVNLTHLQRVLQPGRPAGAPPWFLRADGDTLALTTEGVMIDAERFDAGLRRARRLDDDHRTREALFAYGEALALVRGGYLDEWPDVAWAEIERLRMRTLTTTARCRAGELLLALGEPEQAAGLAGAVLATEPLQERAARLLARAAVAQDDRAAARRLLGDLLDRVVAGGLDPEPDTIALASSVGLRAASPAEHALRDDVGGPATRPE